MSTSIISLKFTASSTSCHDLLTRRVYDVAALILNVPPWCNEAHLKSLLAETCGPVQLLKFLSESDSRAWLSPSPPPIPVVSETIIESPYFKPATEIRFHDALLVFKSALGVESLMALTKDRPLVLQSESRKPVTGMRRWISDYTTSIITDWDHFQKDLDDYMIQYDARKADEDAKLKETGEEADEEGWVTVTSKSKKSARKPNKNSNSNNSDRSRAKAKAVGKNKELLNFYKFQKKEKKEDLIQNLRDKFEEDKKRVASMKAERRFKPY